jgi:Cytochrome C and Quinol oxidase polypeptide I
VRATEKFSCPLIVLSFILTSLRADWLEVKLAVYASRLLSDAAGASRALPRAGSVAAGFVRAYVFSTDHKMIARQFLFLGLVMMLLGGLLAMLIRWELAWPETSIRWLRWIPEPYLYDGIIPPETYNMFFTMHATLMIFSS